jgi:hypothetical protein
MQGGQQLHKAQRTDTLLCIGAPHLRPPFQIHGICGRLEPGPVQAPQHLRNNGINMDVVQPADAQTRLTWSSSENEDTQCRKASSMSTMLSQS